MARTIIGKICWILLQKRGSRFEQVTIARVRSIPKVWSITRPIRVFIIAQAIEYEFREQRLMNEKILETDELFERKNPFAYDVLHNQVQIFTPNIQNGFHNIHQLAVYQKQILENWNKKYQVILLTPSGKSFADEKEHLDSITKSYSHLQIYHIGNNAQSAAILEKALEGSNTRKIAVLHDLFLLDLLHSYGDQEPNFMAKFALKIEKQYGMFGTLALGRFNQGNGISQLAKITLGQFALTELAPFFDVILFHSYKSDYLTNLPVSIREKFQYIPLPIKYAEIPFKSARSKKGQIIVISGMDSRSKKIKTQILGILLAMSRDSRISCVVIGSVSQSVKMIIDEMDVKSDEKRKFKFIQRRDDETWRKTHESATLAIRLGVGGNGECSGLIRDYIGFGINVVTDEATPDLRKMKNMKIVEDDINPSELAEIIIQFLSEKHKIDNKAGVKSSEVKYVKQLKSVLRN